MSGTRRSFFDRLRSRITGEGNVTTIRGNTSPTGLSSLSNASSPSVVRRTGSSVVRGDLFDTMTPTGSEETLPEVPQRAGTPMFSTPLNTGLRDRLQDPTLETPRSERAARRGRNNPTERVGILEARQLSAEIETALRKVAESGIDFDTTFLQDALRSLRDPGFGGFLKRRKSQQITRDLALVEAAYEELDRLNETARSQQSDPRVQSTFGPDFSPTIDLNRTVNTIDNLDVILEQIQLETNLTNSQLLEISRILSEQNIDVRAYLPQIARSVQKISNATNESNDNVLTVIRQLDQQSQLSIAQAAQQAQLLTEQGVQLNAIIRTQTAIERYVQDTARATTATAGTLANIQQQIARLPADVGAEMLAQQGQLALPPPVPDQPTGVPPPMGTSNNEVSGKYFIPESTRNASMLDDTALLANITSNYDSLNRPALAALGAEITYRRDRPLDSQNEFRESLYGPAVSGGMIRQFNRTADMNLTPLKNNVNIKLTQLRNDLVSFIDSFVIEPEPKGPSKYTTRPQDFYEYDAMETQIPEARDSLMSDKSTSDAQDDAVNPHSMARNVLQPEDVDDSLKLVQRGSGSYISKKLRSAKLKNLVGPTSSLFTAMYAYMNTNNESSLQNVQRAIGLLVRALQQYQIDVGPYVYQGIILSCSVANSAIESYMYNMTQITKSKLTISQYDQKMRQGVSPSVKTYAPY